MTVRKLRQDLLDTRSELHQTQEENAKIVSDIRTIVGQVNQRITFQVDELTVDKEQLEDQVDALRD